MIFSNITKEKIRISKLGNKCHLGKLHSIETKEKIRLNNIGSKHSDETRKKMSISHTGKHYHTLESKEKIRKANIGKILSKETREKLRNRICSEDTKLKIKLARAKQITPIKDTSIEVKIQNYLKQLNIEFFTHQYIKEIDNGYQCDISIPVQKGINQKTIIECDGDYWHNYPNGREIDNIRTKELIEKGFKVIRLWEREIKLLNLENFKEKL
jgi:G:T-mismatch repair DNA endonuclease (very short patch repair protein)